MLLRNLFILFGSIAVITFTTIFVMRFLVKISVLKNVTESGVLANDEGIEYFSILGTKRIAYKEISSVELLPFHTHFLKTLFLFYGISVRRILPYHSNKILIIRIKNPNPIEYFFFSPMNPEEIMRKIQLSVEK